MGKFVNIKDNDFESTLCEFLDPDLVYVPYDKSYKLCIKDGDKVCFNDAIFNFSHIINNIFIGYII